MAEYNEIYVNEQFRELCYLIAKNSLKSRQKRKE